MAYEIVFHYNFMIYNSYLNTGKKMSKMLDCTIENCKILEAKATLFYFILSSLKYKSRMQQNQTYNGMCGRVALTMNRATWAICKQNPYCFCSTICTEI